MAGASAGGSGRGGRSSSAAVGTAAAGVHRSLRLEYSVPLSTCHTCDYNFPQKCEHWAGGSRVSGRCDT